ncbi:kynurenine 3-monooxygenase [Angomonas deanei]|uniref:Uncharacterized protein n=1 Tax=Angomonas deanei TaxID=59799 RepID=A0A7G2CSD6_9TRYP|nr:kynurenine 3-monooxygenase [Angomonas deanei]CAD2221894.1 hypothetical protein, conserved [Angomonas deanei]|eukprot:EPY28355.1 kynurenine 3-monooxygenase [Angomonas deanei]
MKPFRGSAAETAFLEQQQLLSSDKKDKREVTEDVLNAFSEKRKKSKKNTSLALNTLKWEKLKQNPSYEMGDYDLLVSCEGKNSHLRHLLDVEGFSGDIDFAQQWFLLRLDKNQNNKFYLNPRYIHRWLHKRQTQSYYEPSQYHVRSAYQVPLVLAYPRVENENLFSVCIYAPLGELKTMTDAEKFRYYMKDVFEADPQAEFTSFSEHNHNIEPAPTIFCENLFNTVGLPSAVLLGNAAHHCNPFWLQSLAIGLEDAVELVNQVDAFSKNIYEALYQFSNERGPAGDALRLITDRSLYYQRKKHVNPFIRFQNYYQHLMQVWMPRGFNNYYDTSTNQLYSKSIEDMFNGRGYTSYEYAEKQQNKHCMFYHLGRLYT